MIIESTKRRERCQTEDRRINRDRRIQSHTPRFRKIPNRRIHARTSEREGQGESERLELRAKQEELNQIGRFTDHLIEHRQDSLAILLKIHQVLSHISDRTRIAADRIDHLPVWIERADQVPYRLEPGGIPGLVDVAVNLILLDHAHSMALARL